MDILTYFLLSKFLSYKITVPVYNYFQLGAYDASALSTMANSLLSALDKEQTGEEEESVKLPITKLMLFGIFNPVSA